MIHIRTFYCERCRSLHDEACPPRKCGALDLVAAADFGMPPEFMNQHGTGLVVYEDAHTWMAQREAEQEVA